MRRQAGFVKSTSKLGCVHTIRNAQIVRYFSKCQEPSATAAFGRTCGHSISGKVQRRRNTYRISRSCSAAQCKKAGKAGAGKIHASRAASVMDFAGGRRRSAAGVLRPAGRAFYEGCGPGFKGAALEKRQDPRGALPFFSPAASPKRRAKTFDRRGVKLIMQQLPHYSRRSLYKRSA